MTKNPPAYLFESEAKGNWLTLKVDAKVLIVSGAREYKNLFGWTVSEMISQMKPENAEKLVSETCQYCRDVILVAKVHNLKVLMQGDGMGYHAVAVVKKKGE